MHAWGRRGKGRGEVGICSGMGKVGSRLPVYWGLHLFYHRSHSLIEIVRHIPGLGGWGEAGCSFLSHLPAPLDQVVQLGIHAVGARGAVPLGHLRRIDGCERYS